MQTIGRDEYEKLIAGAEVLARDDHGDKVLRLAGGDVLKLFRVKHMVSSARIWPHVIRFARAAQGLRERDVPTVRVQRVMRVPHIRRDAVVYAPLPGRTLRGMLDGADATTLDVLLDRFARFLATLHHRGVYFRAIHFGNVLVTDDGELGLIDVSEARLLRRPLGAWRRARNFRPMVRYDEDRAALRAFGMQRFVDRYIEASGLDGVRRRIFSFVLGLRPPLGPGALPFSDSRVS